MINNSNSYNALHPVNIYELAALYINDINLTMKKGTKSQDETWQTKKKKRKKLFKKN